jgi:hypothetical protein
VPPLPDRRCGKIAKKYANSAKMFETRNVMEIATMSVRNVKTCGMRAEKGAKTGVGPTDDRDWEPPSNIG